MTLYAVGDIQGCSAPFEELLERLAFDPARDRLWLVGDLVNRGPDSLGVLRRVKALGDAAVCVLGNHDLHLLATAAGSRSPRPSDTFADVLRAPDADELLDWLRRRPLLYRDAAARRVLVHAGIPPQWNVHQAREHAEEIERLLRSDAWREALATMYGDEPRLWREDLDDVARRRFTINGLTRMRYCDRQGRLDLTQTGAPGSQPRGLVPWFDVPGRVELAHHIVFGHWAALGLLRRDDVTALDSGCVWGNALTAVPLDPPGPPVHVKCTGPRPPA
ncbi:MAG TPA: symmetrical bis(5'-nucleosyl)-tetraphosphatase [Gammaproteobacteria bacterium]